MLPVTVNYLKVETVKANAQTKANKDSIISSTQQMRSVCCTGVGNILQLGRLDKSLQNISPVILIGFSF